MYEPENTLIAGIDEAGRGPLAGPVTAAAVILPGDFDLSILDDSKKLSEKKREAAASVILEKALSCSTGWVWASEIDRINIHNASLLAMKRAVQGLSVKADIYLFDGKYTPDMNGNLKAVIKGDTSEYCIMAASIIAKTARDRWMKRYSWIETLWEFEKHKGYPTKRHAELIRKNGFSCIHRKTFNVPYAP